MGGHHAPLALGEHPGLGRAHARDVAHRVDAREAGGQGSLIDGDPAFLCHPGGLHDRRYYVNGDAQEQVEGEAPAVVEQRLVRVRVQGRDPAVGQELDVSLGEGRQDRLRGGGRRRDRRAERDHDLDPDVVANAALAQELVQQERRLAGRRRALERGSAHSDDRRAGPERWEDLAKGLGARHGVELVAGLHQARRRCELIVGAEGHDQNVGLVGVEVGHHTPPDRVNLGDGLLAEAHLRRCDRAVAEVDDIGCPLPEHHVQLREAEYEGVGAIDQRDIDLVAELLRQRG